MVVKENRRVRMTKAMIKQTIIEMLQTTDIRHITVRELCEKADVNRATFYKYFDNPYHLLDEINMDFMSEINSYVKLMSGDFGSSMIALLHFIQQNQQMCKILIDNHSEINYLESIISQPAVAEQISATFTESKSKGNPYLRDFVLYGTYNVVLSWLKKGCPESAEQLARYILSMNIDLKGSDG